MIKQYLVPSEYRFFAGVDTVFVDELEALLGVCFTCFAGVGAELVGGDIILIRRFVAY